MFSIRNACETDGPTILQLIRELAEYERLLHEVGGLFRPPCPSLTATDVSSKISP
jgi:hypothetical protein